MERPVSRRQLLAAVGGGLASLTGCQSVLGLDVSVTVHVLNATAESQDAYLELSRPDDEAFHIGRVLPIEEGVIRSVELTIPTGRYQMMVNIDDVVPRPEKTVAWEITDDECTRDRYWTIAPAETGPDLRVVEPNCERSTSQG